MTTSGSEAGSRQISSHVCGSPRCYQAESITLRLTHQHFEIDRLIEAKPGLGIRPATLQDVDVNGVNFENLVVFGVDVHEWRTVLTEQPRQPSR